MTLPRYTPLKPVSDRRRAQREAAGLPVFSTLSRSVASGREPRTVAVKPRRGRNTGPTDKVRRIVDARSGGWCEWPTCRQPATDTHHRLNRKAGGRHGAMRQRINQPAWLLHACRLHHDYVTSPTGGDRVLCEAWGWLLREGNDALAVPVLTRHATRPVLLDDAGGCVFPRPADEEH